MGNLYLGNLWDNLWDNPFEMYPLVITNSLLWKMAIEFLSSPIKNGGSFHGYVELPEGMGNLWDNRWGNSENLWETGKIKRESMGCLWETRKSMG